MVADGIYGFVYTADTGVGIGAFKLSGGKLVGSDGAIGYDGIVTEDPGTGRLKLDLKMHVPAGVSLVQGTSPQSEPYTKHVSVETPPNFGGGEPVKMILAPGPVTVMFKRVSDDYERYIHGFVVTPKAK